MKKDGGEYGTRWRRKETRCKRIGNKMEENRKQDGGEYETRWRRI